jgi:hypothetical protein
MLGSQFRRPGGHGRQAACDPFGLPHVRCVLAAWLLDHDVTTYEHLAQLFAGHPYGAITREDWLDNTRAVPFVVPGEGRSAREQGTGKVREARGGQASGACRRVARRSGGRA